MAQDPLRLLVVDDSAYNRALLSRMFDKHPEVTVVGRAADGEEALRLAASTQPDVITLDLEMPKMDGFTFLRLQLAKRPVPIIVVSSYAQRENVFRALELGAYDFVAKTASQIGEAEGELQRGILEKVLGVRALDPASFARMRPRLPAAAESRGELGAAAAPDRAPELLVCIASSTGGPAALSQIAAGLPPKARAALLVAQHMPEKFTRTFAERLGKKGTWPFFEAMGGMPISAGAGIVSPGAKCIEVQKTPRGWVTTVADPRASDRYVPSADRLFASAAAAFGTAAVGVVLTGMGDDALAGARAIRDHGGIVLAESAETAVAQGMPRAVARAGLANEVLPLSALALRLAELTRA